MTATVPKLVIVGAGFAGMWAALSASRKRELAGLVDDALEIILVAPEPILYVRPRLYEPDVSTASAPLTDLFDAVAVRFFQGTVQQIAADKNTVEYTTPDGTASSLTFDRLVLASGSTLFRPASVSGLVEHSFNADQMDSALELDAHLKSLSGLPDTPARNTVIVCGGSFTGVEIAAEMPQRLRSILGESVAVKVIILDRSDSIDFMRKSSPVVAEALTSLGVEVLTGQSVASIDAEGLTTKSGLRIPSKTVIWAAGLRASALTAQIPGKRDDIGRLHTTQTLQVIGVENVYAIGDVAHVAVDDEGHLVLMACQHAMNLGKAAGNNAVADLLGLPQHPYSQPFYVTCLALGPWGALFSRGWDREVVLVKEEGHKMKKYINTQLIYPPPPNRAEAFAEADPAKQLIA